MEEFELTGDVLAGDLTILEDVLFSIKLAIGGSRQGLGGWRGHFEMPEDAEAEIEFEDERELTVKFEDGRRGMFVARNGALGSNRTVQIEGIGNLR
ncbi:MAG: hypothetical protein EOP06_21785 [Proteobacteria bacterium]|nr:MAG: hypothetical protein EOP06_21785 [Pseudomonadota bacterium]